MRNVLLGALVPLAFVAGLIVQTNDVDRIAQETRRAGWNDAAAEFRFTIEQLQDDLASAQERRRRETDELRAKLAPYLRAAAKKRESEIQAGIAASARKPLPKPTDPKPWFQAQKSHWALPGQD